MSIIKPKRFAGLHAHDGASVYDGLGPATEHIDFCIENGLDAWAMTNHGHMNSFATAYLHLEKLKAKGVDFKLLPGVEAYMHPSLDQWRDDYAKTEERKKNLKEAKKQAKKDLEGKKRLIEVIKDGNDEPIDIETTNALTIENEDETKGSTKFFNPVNRRHHLVVIPKNAQGLLSVFKLVSRGYIEGFYRFPRIDMKMLSEAGKDGNIIVSTACLGGPLSYETLRLCQDVEFDELGGHLLDDPSLRAKVINNIGNTYGMLADAVGEENAFLELQFNRLPAQDLVNRGILEFAKENGLNDRLVVTCDSHYAHPEKWKEREIYKKLGWMNYAEYDPESLPKSRAELKAELYPKNAEQVWESYQEVKKPWYDDQLICDAIERTHDVAHQVIGDVTIEKGYRYPTKSVIGDKDPFKVLMEQSIKGLKDKGLDSKPEYVDRLRHELGIIQKMKNAAYFVTLAHALNLARKVCLLGVARGSSGGSLVAYVLGITDLDPIKYECRFDRFLNPYREGAPDIDVDVGDRDAVLEVLREEFGFNNVVPISNINTFKVKTLLKDLSKFHSVPFDEANAATKTVEQEVRKATQKHGDDKNLFILKFEDAMKYSESFRSFMEKYPQVGEHAESLFKEQRSLGRHAGGVVILDDAPSEMPLILNKGEPQTPWVEGVVGKQLEPLGFIKYDLLGLETMRLISRTIELILIKQGNDNPTFDEVRDWYEKHLHPDANSFDDQKVYEYVYHSGRWAGIFQCTSSGAQRLFVRAKPESITDIATLTSIYRPGPLAANVDKIYLESKAGKPYDWGHPAFAEVLGKTYNCLIFQESVMDLAEHIGGFPKDQCDNVRRAIMKRDLSKGDTAIKAAQEMEDAFVKGAVKKGIPEATGRKAYQQILWFAGYGFNRAHATAYAIDSYMCAWLMTYYEEEWLCSYLESMSNNDDNRAKAFSEIRALGYQIVPIDIKHATKHWTIVEGKKMMPSLTACKGVGLSAAEELAKLRPFDSLEELFWDDEGKWRLSKFNKRALEALINVGAFEELDCVGEGKMFKNYRHMYRVIVEHMNDIKKSTKKEPFKGKKAFFELIREYADTKPFTRFEQIQHSIKHFGSADVNAMVGKKIQERLAEKGVKPIDDYEGKNIYWFCVASTTPRTSKNGRRYLIINGVGPAGKSYKIFAWSWTGEKIDPYTVMLGEVSQTEFGLQTSFKKIRTLNLEG